MLYYDAVVIGGGLLGCFTARNLRRYDVSVALLEAREDVCTGVSRANTAVVYGGQDNKPGTRKAGACRRANETFGELCETLGVRFSRCGSLMVCFGEGGLRKLRRGLERGTANGVAGLRLISGHEARALEPGLNPAVHAALYAENTGTVDPWELCLAAAENACLNGAEFRLREAVLHIERGDGFFSVFTEKEEYRCRFLVNCAGLGAEKINAMLGFRDILLAPTRADYMVLGEKHGRDIGRVIFYEPEEKGRGITAVPTVDGNLMLGPSEISRGGAPAFETTADGLRFIREQAALLLPGTDTCDAVRVFSAARPNPRYASDTAGNVRSIDDFPIFTPESAPGYVSFCGIKTPGMTCADYLGAFAAGRCRDLLGVRENTAFDPVRPRPPAMSELRDAEAGALIAADPRWGRIVCTCKQVSEAEILRAIHAAPPCTTVDGVKRRTGCCLGTCQGSRCTEKIVGLLSRELGVPVSEIAKDGDGSWIIR